MSLLGDAVFMALAAIDAGGAQAVMVQEGGRQSLLQCQEGLAGGDLGVTPPRVAENHLEQQVGIELARDGHAQGIAVGEVDLGLAARRVVLGEVHLLIGSV